MSTKRKLDDSPQTGPKKKKMSGDQSVKKQHNHGDAGLFDIHSSDEDVAVTILEALTSMDPGPDVIGYVIQIGVYTEEEFSAYCRLKALMDDVTDHMVIILTYGDRLKGHNVWDKLQQAPRHLRTVLEECEHRVVVFDNTSPYSKLSQVKALLREVRKLKKQNHQQPYTLELDDDVEAEVEARLLRVEKMETRRKAFVRKLIQKKAAAKDTLLAERENWTTRRKQLEESSCRMEKTMNNKKKDLSKKLCNQKRLSEEIKEEIDSLEEQLEDFVHRRK